MRLAILGNSGSGKSTLARALHEAHALPLLELDTIVWEPGQIAVLRAREAIDADIARFVAESEGWIVEGCYAELIGALAPYRPELIFLNPGEAACVENNRRRPWEPHKYSSKEDQDRMLDNLLAWVRGYYQRDDAWSLAAHRRLFDSYAGPKRELTGLVDPGAFSLK